MIIRKRSISRSSSLLDDLRGLLDEARAIVADTSGNIEHGARQAGHRLHSCVDEGWSQIKARPKTSATVALAVTAGLVAGYILWRRR